MQPTQHRLGGRVPPPLPASTVVRPATPLDATLLAPRLREGDAAELHASTGLPAVEALKQSLGFGGSLVAEVNGTVEFVFGCPRSDDATGIPWLLGTDLLVDRQFVAPFLRVSRHYVAEWQREYPLLHNFTDARNTVHHRWLRWLGFTFIARHDRFGPFGLPFFEFVRI